MRGQRITSKHTKQEPRCLCRADRGLAPPPDATFSSLLSADYIVCWPPRCPLGVARATLSGGLSFHFLSILDFVPFFFLLRLISAIFSCNVLCAPRVCTRAAAAADPLASGVPGISAKGPESSHGGSVQMASGSSLLNKRSGAAWPSVPTQCLLCLTIH